MKQLGVVLGSAMMLALGLIVAGVGPALGGHNDKIYICHAAGQEGTTHFETLHLPPAAVYGPGGHFNENGTPKAGHEQDYFGKCEGPPPTTTGTTPTDTTPTDTTPTDTTPTDTTPTTPTEPTETTPTETTPTPEQPRCKPGEGPYRGKDGAAGNDECCPDSNSNQICDDEEQPPTQRVAPPPTTTTATPPPPTVTAPATQPPTTPAPTSKPKPAPKPKAKRKTTPKPDHPRVAVKHVCKTLADGTRRVWFKGGNGLKPGCYAVVEGSG